MVELIGKMSGVSPEVLNVIEAVRELNEQIKRSRGRLEKLRLSAAAISPPKLDGVPHAKPQCSAVELLTVKIVEAEEELRELESRLPAVKMDLTLEILERVSDEVAATVLLLRYVECLTARETARRMGYTLRMIFIIQARAKLEYDSADQPSRAALTSGVACCSIFSTLAMVS